MYRDHTSRFLELLTEEETKMFLDHPTVTRTELLACKSKALERLNAELAELVKKDRG